MGVLDDVAVLTYLPLAHKLAYQIQWSDDDHMDLVQEGLMALLTGFREHRARGVIPKDMLSWAGYVMNGWMKWWYSKKDRSKVELQILDHAQAQVTGWDEFERDIYYRAYYEALEKTLGAEALDVARNLITPGHRVLDLAHAEMKEKIRRKAAGEKVRGYATLRIKHEHIRHALGFDEDTWFRVLDQLRIFTRQWMCEPHSALA